MAAKRPSATARPSAARPSSARARPHSSAHARPQSSAYTHPYLTDKHPASPPKRELGLCDLFFVKLFRCFVSDELPPPNPHATVYQADKSSSTNVSVTTTTATTTTASTGLKDGNPSVPQKTRIVMPEYNKPPPEAPKPPPKRVVAPGRHGEVRREAARMAPPVREANAWDRASAPLGVAAPSSPHSNPDMPRQMFGKVSSLSSLFENNDE